MARRDEGLLSEVFCLVAELLAAAGARGIDAQPGCWERDLGEGWHVTVNGHTHPTMGGPEGVWSAIGPGRVVGWYGSRRVGSWGPWQPLAAGALDPEGARVFVDRLEGAIGEAQGLAWHGARTRAGNGW